MKARLQRLVMNAQSHPGAMPQAPTCHAVFSSRSLVRRRISGQWSVVRSLRELLSDFLKLLTDYRTVEAIDGDVKPIAFFAFHYEVSRTSAASPIAEGERMKVRGFRRERPAA